jgi:hypothetical protein
MTNSNQAATNETIELLFVALTKDADVQKFETTIQQNINTKRLSSTNEQDFFDRLMLNIAYFVDNKKVWNEVLRTILISKERVTRTSIEARVLQEQMVIRESIATKMEEYKAIFHKQYETLNITVEDVVYDYAYASVQHALRFDILSYMIEKNAVETLKAAELEETVRIMDGYVSYFADQYVNQMELK